MLENLTILTIFENSLLGHQHPTHPKFLVFMHNHMIHINILHSFSDVAWEKLNLNIIRKVLVLVDTALNHYWQMVCGLMTTLSEIEMSAELVTGFLNRKAFFGLFMVSTIGVFWPFHVTNHKERKLDLDRYLKSTEIKLVTSLSTFASCIKNIII